MDSLKIWDSSNFYLIKPKLDMGLFSDFCVIYLFLPVFAWCAHKIVLLWSAEQFYEHIMQKPVKPGKYTEINKQSDVKFWLNCIKFGAVLYLLSCKIAWEWKFQCNFIKNLTPLFVCLLLADAYLPAGEPKMNHLQKSNTVSQKNLVIQKAFSYFSNMFLNPNIFFQFES